MTLTFLECMLYHYSMLTLVYSSAGHFLDTDILAIGMDTSIAQVFSPIVALTSNKVCLQFYYHMYGYSLDSLHVYKKQANVITSVL